MRTDDPARQVADQRRPQVLAQPVPHRTALEMEQLAKEVAPRPRVDLVLGRIVDRQQTFEIVVVRDRAEQRRVRVEQRRHSLGHQEPDGGGMTGENVDEIGIADDELQQLRLFQQQPPRHRNGQQRAQDLRFANLIGQSLLQLLFAILVVPQQLVEKRGITEHGVETGDDRFLRVGVPCLCDGSGEHVPPRRLLQLRHIGQAAHQVADLANVFALELDPAVFDLAEQIAILILENLAKRQRVCRHGSPRFVI